MSTKTSQTDPIRVDFVPIELVGLPGRLGMTFAPGKKAAGIGGRWERDLGADLERLRRVYRGSVLVSLVEEAELRALGIPGLMESARSAGLAPHLFPIVDGSIPSSPEGFIELVAVVLEAAAHHNNVIIHCRGGLGRTGLLAGACLVALGHPPDEAIRILREARPGAIETREQEAFLGLLLTKDRLRRACPPRPAPTVELSRFRGCLLGGALGDALGYPVEFATSAAAIRARHGTSPPPDLAYAGTARISDDTQMTLFTAEGVIRGLQRGADRGICDPASSIQRALLRWYETQGGAHADLSERGWLIGIKGLHAQRAPGNTCLSALADQARKWWTPTVEAVPNDSKGCGAVMRSAPIGLAMATREDAFATARDAAVLTHGHPSGYLSAGYFAAVVFDVARGLRLEAAMEEADALLACERGHEEMVAAVAKARATAEAGPPDADAIERIGGGWVGEEALAIALACALTVEAASPKAVARCLWNSVVHKGDSDSTGSLTGNLLGAMFGLEALPEAWLKQLELRGVIDRVACDLHAAGILGTELDFETYPPN